MHAKSLTVQRRKRRKASSLSMIRHQPSTLAALLAPSLFAVSALLLGAFYADLSILDSTDRAHIPEPTSIALKSLFRLNRSRPQKCFWLVSTHWIVKPLSYTDSLPQTPKQSPLTKSLGAVSDTHHRYFLRSESCPQRHRQAKTSDAQPELAGRLRDAWRGLQSGRRDVSARIIAFLSMVPPISPKPPGTH